MSTYLGAIQLYARHRRQNTARRPALLIGVITCQLCITAALAHADERRFTFTYEVTTQEPGMVEYEQWVTWKTDKDIDPKFDRFEFRHEFEFGLTDDLQMGAYVSDWRYQRDSSGSKTQWRNAAVEFIYQLSDPGTDLLGSALYGEVKLGDELFEIEAKMLVQKNLGKWVLAWNGVFEAEWEGEHFDDDKGQLGQTLGASYQISPNLMFGAEVVHEIEIADWSTWEDHVLYVGPNASFRTDNWWVTLTGLVQVTDIASEPNFVARLIFGFDF